MSETKVMLKDPSAVEFVPLGSSDKIRLTAALVREYIAVPTWKGNLPTERDCIRFIMLCKGKRANPFEGDCYLIGYENDKGPPTFSMVCGIDLFLKRAEQEQDFDGIESGVIIMRADGTLEERPGSIVINNERLVGGWARVYRKGRRIPEYKAAKFSVYDTGKSRWKTDQGGMIEKVARSQALRTAFPTPLGGMYAREEMDALHESGSGLISIEGQVKEALDAIKPEVTEPEQPETSTAQAAPQPPVNSSVRVISEPQTRRLFAILDKSDKSEADLHQYLDQVLSIQHVREIPVSAYDALCAWVELKS